MLRDAETTSIAERMRCSPLGGSASHKLVGVSNLVEHILKTQEGRAQGTKHKAMTALSAIRRAQPVPSESVEACNRSVVLEAQI